MSKWLISIRVEGYHRKAHMIVEANDAVTAFNNAIKTLGFLLDSKNIVEVEIKLSLPL